MNRFTRPALVLALMLATRLAMAVEHEPVVVYAAASLTDTLQTIADAYTKASGTPVKLSFAGSSALARQIESGARADVFFSADQDWMDYLDQRALIKKGSRVDVLGNRLALIAPSDSKVALNIARDAPLLAALGESGRLATGDPDFVPAGKYAKSALTALNLWSALESRLARAENVRVALMYVARGEAPLGIVYATDAAIEPRVRIVGLFPESTHTPITYPVAELTSARPAAASFIAFLRGPFARSTFEAAGFRLLAPPATTGARSCLRFELNQEPYAVVKSR